MNAIQTYAEPISETWRTRGAAFIEARSLAESSRETYARTLSMFILWMNSQGIDNPNARTLADFRRLLTERMKGGGQESGLTLYTGTVGTSDRDLSPGTVAKYLTIIRGFFRWLKDRNEYPDITQELKIPRVESDYTRQPVPVDKSGEILSYLDGLERTPGNLRQRAIGYLLFYCGLRSIEVSRARVEHLITKTGSRALKVHGKGRSGAGEPVFLGPAADPLADYLASRGNPSSGPMFASIRSGQAIGTRPVQDMIRGWYRAVGIAGDPSITPHSTRHTAATAALTGGASLPQVQRMLRHKNVAVTGRYLHMLEDYDSSANSFIKFPSITRPGGSNV